MKSSETELGLDGTKTRYLHQIVWILRIGSLGSKVDSDWPSTEKAVTARSSLGTAKAPQSIRRLLGQLEVWGGGISTEAERTISIKTSSTQLFPILILSGCLSKNLSHESLAY